MLSIEMFPTFRSKSYRNSSGYPILYIICQFNDIKRYDNNVFLLLII